MALPARGSGASKSDSVLPTPAAAAAADAGSPATRGSAGRRPKPKYSSPYGVSRSARGAITSMYDHNPALAALLDDKANEPPQPAGARLLSRMTTSDADGSPHRGGSMPRRIDSHLSLEDSNLLPPPSPLSDFYIAGNQNDAPPNVLRSTLEHYFFPEGGPSAHVVEGSSSELEGSTTAAAATTMLVTGSRKPLPRECYRYKGILRRESNRLDADVRNECARMWTVTREWFKGREMSEAQYRGLFGEVALILRKRYSADSEDDGSDSDKASAGPQAASTHTQQRQTKKKKKKAQQKKKRKPVLPQQQLDAILDSDWARDRQGRQSLNRDRFFLAWFQIADQWTSGVGAREYAELLAGLFRDIVGSDSRVRRIRRRARELQKLYDEQAEQAARRSPSGRAKNTKRIALPLVRDHTEWATPLPIPHRRHTRRKRLPSSASMSPPLHDQAPLLSPGSDAVSSDDQTPRTSPVPSGPSTMTTPVPAASPGSQDGSTALSTAAATSTVAASEQSEGAGATQGTGASAHTQSTLSVDGEAAADGTSASGTSSSASLSLPAQPSPSTASTVARPQAAAAVPASDVGADADAVDADAVDADADADADADPVPAAAATTTTATTTAPSPSPAAAPAPASATATDTTTTTATATATATTSATATATATDTTITTATAPTPAPAPASITSPTALQSQPSLGSLSEFDVEANGSQSSPANHKQQQATSPALLRVYQYDKTADAAERTPASAATTSPQHKPTPQQHPQPRPQPAGVAADPGLIPSPISTPRLATNNNNGDPTGAAQPSPSMQPSTHSLSTSGVPSPGATPGSHQPLWTSSSDMPPAEPAPRQLRNLTPRFREGSAAPAADAADAEMARIHALAAAPAASPIPGSASAAPPAPTPATQPQAAPRPRPGGPYAEAGSYLGSTLYEGRRAATKANAQHWSKTNLAPAGSTAALLAAASGSRPDVRRRRTPSPSVSIAEPPPQPLPRRHAVPRLDIRFATKRSPRTAPHVKLAPGVGFAAAPHGDAVAGAPLSARLRVQGVPQPFTGPAADTLQQQPTGEFIRTERHERHGTADAEAAAIARAGGGAPVPTHEARDAATGAMDGSMTAVEAAFTSRRSRQRQQAHQRAQSATLRARTTGRSPSAPSDEDDGDAFDAVRAQSRPLISTRVAVLALGPPAVTGQASGTVTRRGSAGKGVGDPSNRYTEFMSLHTQQEYIRAQHYIHGRPNTAVPQRGKPLQHWSSASPRAHTALGHATASSGKHPRHASTMPPSSRREFSPSPEAAPSPLPHHDGEGAPLAATVQSAAAGVQPPAASWWLGGEHFAPGSVAEPGSSTARYTASSLLLVADGGGSQRHPRRPHAPPSARQRTAPAAASRRRRRRSRHPSPRDARVLHTVSTSARGSRGSTRIAIANLRRADSQPQGQHRYEFDDGEQAAGIRAMPWHARHFTSDVRGMARSMLHSPRLARAREHAELKSQLRQQQHRARTASAHPRHRGARASGAASYATDDSLDSVTLLASEDTPAARPWTSASRRQGERLHGNGNINGNGNGDGSEMEQQDAPPSRAASAAAARRLHWFRNLKITPRDEDAAPGSAADEPPPTQPRSISNSNSMHRAHTFSLASPLRQGGHLLHPQDKYVVTSRPASSDAAPASDWAWRFEGESDEEDEEADEEEEYGRLPASGGPFAPEQGTGVLAALLAMRYQEGEEEEESLSGDDDMTGPQADEGWDAAGKAERPEQATSWHGSAADSFYGEASQQLPPGAGTGTSALHKRREAQRHELRMAKMFPAALAARLHDHRVRSRHPDIHQLQSLRFIDDPARQNELHIREFSNGKS